MTFSDIFDREFPYYLSYGMSYDEYWNGNPYLVVAYREAHKLEIQKKNEELWLQGRYIFDAVMIAISNVHLDGKKHSVNQYNEKPYDLFAKSEVEKKKEVENARQKVIDYFNKFAKAFNSKKKGQ